MFTRYIRTPKFEAFIFARKSPLMVKVWSNSVNEYARYRANNRTDARTHACTNTLETMPLATTLAGRKKKEKDSFRELLPFSCSVFSRASIVKRITGQSVHCIWWLYWDDIHIVRGSQKR